MLLIGGRGNDCQNSIRISIIWRDRKGSFAVDDAVREGSGARSKVCGSSGSRTATGAPTSSLASGVPESLARNCHHHLCGAAELTARCLARGRGAHGPEEE